MATTSSSHRPARRASATAGRTVSNRKRPAPSRRTSAAKPVGRRAWHHRLTGFAKAKPLAFAGIFAALGVVITSFSGAATVAPTGRIVNANTKCLNNYVQQSVNDNKVVLWTCNSTAAQQWSLPGDGTIQAQGKCLDVLQQAKSAGSQVVIYTCSTARPSQQWTVRADKSIRNKASGLCLDNYAQATADGNKIVIWTCNASVAQQWTVPAAATPSPATPPTTPAQTTPAPATAPASNPVAAPATAGLRYPANVLDLSKWKLNTPKPDSSGLSTEIKQPALASFSDDRFFFLNAAKTGVIFRTYFGGATTSGSNNPRTELREMSGANGTTNASWSSTSGTHTLTVRGKVNRLTKVKPHLVIAQIHDADDDVTVFRLEGTTLYLTNGDTTHWQTVTTDFQLGTEHTWGFKVSGGKVQYVFDGKTLPYTLTKSFSNAYFKAGSYLQSNPKDGKSPGESTSQYAEVELLGLQFSHN